MSVEKLDIKNIIEYQQIYELCKDNDYHTRMLKVIRKLINKVINSEGDTNIEKI